MKFQWFILFLAILLGVWVIHEYMKNRLPENLKDHHIAPPKTSDEKTSDEKPKPTPTPVKTSYGNRKIKGTLPANFDPGSIHFENEVSEIWPQLLEKNLNSQLQGNKIKLKEIEKIESYITYKKGYGRFVESVIIRLENKEGLPSSFRAEVDSKTGHVLKTWDRPIFDQFDRAHKKHLKIDPDGELR